MRYTKAVLLRRRFNVKKYRVRRNPRRKLKPRFVRKRIGSKFSRMGRIVSGLPEKLKYTFKSISNNLQVSPAGTFVTYSFNVNSISDPFGTGGSSRPYLYNQFKGLYNRYKVIGGHVKFTFISQMANPCTVGICIRSDNEAPTTLQELSIIRGGYFKVLTSEAGSRSGCTLIKRFSIQRWFGKDGFFDATSSLFDSEPTRRLYCFVCIESNDFAVADDITGIARIEIFQRTVLLDPEVQDMSAPAVAIQLVPTYIRKKVSPTAIEIPVEL